MAGVVSENEKHPPVGPLSPAKPVQRGVDAAQAPIAISMGDPAGVGLEIVGKAWCARRPGDVPFLLIADAQAAQQAASGAKLQIIASAAQAGTVFPSALPILPIALAAPPVPGKPDTQNAPAILEAIRLGVHLARSGEACALTTLPIAKHVLYEAGFPFAGHTEFLAELTGSARPVMLLAGESLRVALATIHMPLAAVPDALSIEGLVAIGRIVHTALRRDFGIAEPRIALAGLNPHAGEGGSIGREEQDILNPAAALLRQEGVAITNAQPADTLFHTEARAGYDAVLAMTHDQGLIPLKTLHFWDAVNITLGLPIVRTSPDHGTAFDIAGKGVARPDSLICALQQAGQMAARRARA